MPQVQLGDSALEFRPEVMTKEQLVAALNSQMESIQEELKSGSVTINSKTTDVYEAQLEKFYQSNLLKRLHKLRKSDLDFQKAEAGDTEKSAYARDKALWEQMEKCGYRFNTRKTKGNEISGRWDRALKADAAMRKEYKKCLRIPDKDAFRARWAAKSHKEWKAEHGMEKSESNEREERLQGTYLSLGRTTGALKSPPPSDVSEWKVGRGASRFTAESVCEFVPQGVSTCSACVYSDLMFLMMPRNLVFSVAFCRTAYEFERDASIEFLAWP